MLYFLVYKVICAWHCAPSSPVCFDIKYPLPYFENVVLINILRYMLTNSFNIYKFASELLMTEFPDMSPFIAFCWINLE